MKWGYEITKWHRHSSRPIKLWEVRKSDSFKLRRRARRKRLAAQHLAVISRSSRPMIELMTEYKEKIANFLSTSEDQLNSSSSSRSLLVKSLKTWRINVRALIIRQRQSHLYQLQPRYLIMSAQSQSTVKSLKRPTQTHLISQSTSIKSETLTDKPPSWLRCRMRPLLSPRSLRSPPTGVIQKRKRILQPV